MSLSMNVCGLRDRTSETHLRNVAVLKACQEAQVQLPVELQAYFREDGRNVKHISPDDAVSIELGTPIVTPYMSQNYKGLDVHLDQLPPGVKTIRFYNSY